MTNEQRETIRQAYGHLGAAIVASLPTDDHIIMNHVREAHTLLHTLFFASVSGEEKAHTSAWRGTVPCTGPGCLFCAGVEEGR